MSSNTMRLALAEALGVDHHVPLNFHDTLYIPEEIDCPATHEDPELAACRDWEDVRALLDRRLPL